MIKRALLSIVSILFGLLILSEAAAAEERSGTEEGICDIIAAREWCDGNMLHRVEGIWEFPEDETTVLVKRNRQMPHRYDIVVVSSPDTRLKPGETAGYMHESADNAQFEMAVYRSRTEGKLSEPAKCLAQLRDNDNTIVAKGRKLSFSLRSWSILPSFWRLVRMTYKDPLENLPRGMIRIYPESTRHPDYL